MKRYNRTFVLAPMGMGYGDVLKLGEFEIEVASVHSSGYVELLVESNFDFVPPRDIDRPDSYIQNWVRSMYPNKLWLITLDVKMGRGYGYEVVALLYYLKDGMVSDYTLIYQTPNYSVVELQAKITELYERVSNE